MSILLSNTYLTYYWIGFLMADGHFTSRLLTVLSHKRDKKHLIKLKKYLKIKHISIERKKYPCLYGYSSYLLPLINKKFDLNNRKTYIPPNSNIFKKMKNNLFLCLFIGYIDGDGSINQKTGRNDFSIIIRNHKNWFNVMRIWIDKLSTIINIKIPNPKIYDKKVCQTAINNKKVILFLKSQIKKFKIPYLNRKWNKIIYIKTFHKKNEKEYSFISPKGKIYYCRGLKDFATKYNLDASSLSAISKGKRKSCNGGWKNNNIKY